MTNKKVCMDAFKAWLPLAITIVIFCGLVYAAVQQNYRQSANDPQIQIAEDISSAIAQGTPPDQIAPPTGTTEISQSLSPFVMIYDDSGKLIGSTAILDGKNPSYPTSVFDSVRQHGQQHVTWQPEAGVRMATVVTSYSATVPSDTATGTPQTVSGFVVAGRSLTEIEKRETSLLVMSVVAGLIALVLTYLVIFFLKKMERVIVAQTETTIEITEEKMVS